MAAGGSTLGLACCSGARGLTREVPEFRQRNHRSSRRNRQVSVASRAFAAKGSFMKLASYIVRGRMGYGAVWGEGVVDLRSRLSALFPNIVELLRENGLAEARAASTGVRPDFPLGDVRLLPPLLAPEKILCIGVNYANRNAELSG